MIASYGRRRGRRLRAGKQELMDGLLPQIEIGTEEMENWRTGEELHSLFPRLSSSPVPHIYLEIGFGGGEHLVYQAAEHRDVGIIGCEPYINGIAELLKNIESHKLENVRIYPGDARLLIEKLPDASLDRIFILYPDPWPKARHHKRRLISKDFLGSLARIMKPGAELRLATDHADYCTWMLEQLLPHSDFSWTAKSCDDWLNPPADWITTRYEQKRLAGMPTYLNFVRV